MYLKNIYYPLLTLLLIQLLLLLFMLPVMLLLLVVQRVRHHFNTVKVSMSAVFPRCVLLPERPSPRVSTQIWYHHHGWTAWHVYGTER